MSCDLPYNYAAALYATQVGSEGDVDLNFAFSDLPYNYTADLYASHVGSEGDVDLHTTFFYIHQISLLQVIYTIMSGFTSSMLNVNVLADDDPACFYFFAICPRTNKQSIVLYWMIFI